MPRGVPRTNEPLVVAETIHQKCQWCSREIASGRDPVIWGTCEKCAKQEAAYLAEEPCPSCGARKGRSPSGVTVKDGHRDSCITRATPVQPRRRLTEEDIAEIRAQLGPAPVPL